MPSNNKQANKKETMLLHEKAEKARMHVRSKLHKKKKKHDHKSTALEAEERTMRTVMDLEEQVRAEHEALVQLDQQRRDQINALVGQLEILGVEPAVHLDDAPPVRVNPPPSLATTRRSLDIPRQKPPRKPALQTSTLLQGSGAADHEHDHEHDPSAADVPRVVVVRAARRPSVSGASEGAESTPEEDENGTGSEGAEDDDEEEVEEGEEEEGEEEDEEYGSGSGSGSGSDENEVGSPRGAGSTESSPRKREKHQQRASRAQSPRLATAEARGNEALQLRLHELECAMEEQDSRHEEELAQLTAQLDDAKALVSQYQSLLGESEVALQRAETAVGLQSAIAAKPQHAALTESERRAVGGCAQVRGALEGLLAALEGAGVQTSGPTMHRLHALLHDIADNTALPSSN